MATSVAHLLAHIAHVPLSSSLCGESGLDLAPASHVTETSAEEVFAENLGIPGALRLLPWPQGSAEQEEQHPVLSTLGADREGVHHFLPSQHQACMRGVSSEASLAR